LVGARKHQLLVTCSRPCASFGLVLQESVRPTGFRLAGEKAKLGRVWPHMVRHSCGYYLADKGTDLRIMQD